jgi:hypothetical protein
MTIEQTVEIPASHRIFLDLPPDLPTGRAKLELTVTPKRQNYHGKNSKNSSKKYVHIKKLTASR